MDTDNTVQERTPMIGTTPGGSGAPSPFWNVDAQLGAGIGSFHRADRACASFLPGVLVVFAHGINSNANTCWEDRPQKLLDELSIDVDILNFQYPAGLFANTSISDAARVLHTLLSLQIQRNRYKDIIFVVHSAGGLVLKQMLVFDTHARRDVLKRTRQIFNFGVPHAGSTSGLSDWGRKTLVFIELLSAPVTYFLRFASMGRLNVGRNRIYVALKHNSNYLAQLEKDYIEIVQRLSDAGESRPESIEIVKAIDTTEIRGTQDVVSYGGPRYQYSSDRDHLTLREEHSSIKMSPISFSAITERIRGVVDSIWAARCQEYDFTVAHLMIQRTQIIESSTGVTRLFKDGESNKPGSGVDQEFCLNQLNDWLFHKFLVDRILVSGSVGVGKSVVLRMLCRKACQRFLSHRSNALILFFPIDRLRVNGAFSNNSDLWIAICRSWIKHTNELLKSTSLPADLPTTITLSWMLRRLEHGRTIVILDGVDEFIANHSELTVQQFAGCLPRAHNEPVRGDLRIVLSARDTLWGLDTLRQHAHHLKMAPLGIDAIRQLFPKLADWISGLTDRDREMLLTPLVVSALLKTHHVPQARSATNILQEAVESVLTGNRFFEKGFTLEPLALVAWIYYRRFQRELSVNEIKKAADELLAEWHAHIADYGSDSAASSKLVECYNNLKALSNPESLRLMLRHSFFFPTTQGSWSLSNEQWRDFLVTFYLSLCVRHKHPSGIAGVALQVDHYERAGDLLADFQVDPDLVARFVSAGKAGSDPFVLGNLASLLGMSCIAMLPAAAKDVARACGDEIHPLGRFVATGRLAGRAIKSSAKNSDFSAVDLRAELSRVLPTILSREDCGSVMRSLCLCYQKAFGFESKETTELATDDALIALIGDISHDTTERFRSLQLSFLHSQYTTASYPERSVAHIHFLFLLTLTRIKGVAISEVCEQLPDLLERGCAMETFYRQYEKIPNLFNIYQQCQRLWENFNSPKAA